MSSGAASLPSAEDNVTQSQSTPVVGRPIMVVSHERSGTHFLMNTLAACFGYTSSPWISIDKHQFNINYYHSPSLLKLMQDIAALRPSNILKSHHDFEFFSQVVDSLRGVIDIVYIYRNPADVLASYWRFLHTWQWVEGPTPDTALDFANAAPMGQLMRLQYRQHDTMLARWANHADKWADAAARMSHVHLVRYEDLADRYEETVRAVGAKLGLAPRQFARPSPHENVVRGGEVPFTPPADADNRAAIADLAMLQFPELMARLGYGMSGELYEPLQPPPPHNDDAVSAFCASLTR